SRNICSAIKILFPSGRGGKRQSSRLALGGRLVVHGWHLNLFQEKGIPSIFELELMSEVE
ncbi:unnamed protein product, partial [Urochloa humidicola]